jgi:hypothetical protein
MVFFSISEKPNFFQKPISEKPNFFHAISEKPNFFGSGVHRTKMKKWQKKAKKNRKRFI